MGGRKMVDRGRLLPASDVFMDTHFGVLFFSGFSVMLCYVCNAIVA
jgi:hypothetical protein